ncbi:MAG: nuclear transport factor 2 family protein [Pseudolabrys sp.]
MADQTDTETLTRLNSEYVRSVQHADTGWFERHLAPDFMNSNPNATLVDRTGFLAQIARGAGVSGLAEDDVIVRIIGDMAIIHARTTYQTADGKPGAGRYTDIWSRQGGRWLCVAAHVNRG